MTDQSLSLQERPSDFLLVAIWFGMISGLGQAGVLTFQKFYQQQIIYFGPHVAWMAPVADTCIFAIPGLALFLLAWRWPRLVSLAKAAFLFTFLSALAKVMSGYLAPYAELLLAAGLAVEVARVVRAHSSGFLWIVRRTTPWMAAGVMSLAICVFAFQQIHERIALAGLPASDPKAPNVLLIVMDTVGAQALSLYGYDRPTTPNLEGLAKTGVVFDRAISTAPWTLPSHASMFTGRHPHELSTGWYRPLDHQYPVLAEVLSLRGYLTAGFVANPWYANSASGLNRGFLRYEDHPISIGEIIRSSSLLQIMTLFNKAVDPRDLLGRKSAAEISDSFLEWASGTGGRPFFAFLNYFDAHEPYLPPEPFLSRFKTTSVSIDPAIINKWNLGQIDISPGDAAALREAYEGAVAYIDDEIGRLINELDKRGLLKNTLLIITSDHGEQFGEHGLFHHGNSLYRQLLHVPLLLSFPAEVPVSKRVEEAVSLRDLPATITDLMRLKGAFQFPGNSLARHWQVQPHSINQETPVLSETQKSDSRRPVPASKGTMASLVGEKMHYIVNGDGGEELYDFGRDHLQQQNLAHSSEAGKMLTTFRALLKKTLAKTWLRDENPFSAVVSRAE